SGSSEKLNYRFSDSNLNQTGMVPNTDMNRNSIGVNAGYQILPNLTFDVAVNWINTGSDNRASYGAKNDDGIMKIFLYMPSNFDMNSLKDYWNKNNSNYQNSPICNMHGNVFNNPYFVVNENLNGNNRDRLFGNVRATYQFNPNLKLMARSG